MNNKILSGAFWLSVGSIISRVLGILYLIPWLMMIGDSNISTAQALFNSAYTPYALFISLGTAGFPSAIARRVAYYNGTKEYSKGKELFHSGIILMGLSGIVCGVILFILAPIVARNSPVVSVRESVKAIRMVVPALVLIPVMSTIRGWFQGNQDLKPFGVSQVIEQLLRVIFILCSTYIIIYVLKLKYYVAVQASVFAAFIGAVFALIYLYTYYKKHQYHKYSFNKKKVSFSNTLNFMKLTLYESIPFLLVGSGITISQLIDQIYFKQIMGFLNYSDTFIQYIYTLFSANPAKITAVVIALATAVSETSLPLLASTEKNSNRIKSLINQNINYLLLMLLPAVIMLQTLAYEINMIFYTKSVIGGTYLKLNLFQSLLMALGINGLTLLQALRYSKKSVIYISIGIIMKLILQFPCVYLFQGKGAIYATNIAFMVVCILSYGKLFKLYKIKLLNKANVVLVNVLFYVITNFLNYDIEYFIVPANKLSAMIYSGILSIIMVFIYILIIDCFDISYRIMGRYILIKKYIPRH